MKTEEPENPKPQHYNESNISEAADVGKTLIQGIAPAEKGWILGFICVVAIIVLSDAWVNLRTIETTRLRGDQTQKYFELVEQNRADQFERSLAVFADQMRRAQEVNRDLAREISRDSERSGLAAMAAVDTRSRVLEDTLTPMGDNPIGPQLPEDK